MMLRAKTGPAFSHKRGMKRKRCSGRDASCENRICTVKCEIGTLSTSRRVHNFNDFRAGYFRRNAAFRSKVDASQTPAIRSLDPNDRPLWNGIDDGACYY